MNFSFKNSENTAKYAMEILAPAGSRESFLAAVNSGADAVYMAGKQFGARAYAANFEVDEIAELTRYAHLRDVHVYIAVNTLVLDEEMPQALEFCHALYNAGADALIVQDMGLVSALRRLYPEIPLNASTQMTLHNSAGVRIAEEMGMKRVILAREVSLREISAIRERTEIALEVFGHGALCICFSGQCLFSSFVGGRSGNRGRCAQPCRLKYQLCDEKGNSHAVGHLLSPKDLNTIQLLPELAAAGAGSLKIEGRMKRPEYVAAVTAAYAAAKRGEPYDERALLQAFNRGFTSAYLQNEPGHDMMSYERPNNRGTRLGRIEKIEPEALVLKLEAPLSVGDGLEIWVSRGGRQGFDVREFAEISPGRVCLPLHGLPVQVRNLSVGDRIFKTSDSRLNEQGEAAYAAYDTMPLSLHFVGRLGKQPVLTASYGDVTAEVAADYEIPLAEKRPADLALLEKQLGRLGGSGWHLAGLTADFDEGIMLPASVLNNLRRSAVLALEDKLLAKYDRTELAPRRERVSAVNAADSAEYAKVSRKQRARLAVAADSLEAAEAAVMAGADYVYWRAWGSKFQPQPDKNALARLAGLNAPVLAMLPTMAFESELAVWRKRLAAYRESGLAGVLVANLWGYKLLRELDWQPEIVADFALNSFNAEAAALWRQFGADRVALSHELNREQLRELCGITKMQTEVQVFGNLEVMNSRHCPIGALCGGKESGKACDGACRRSSYHLRDEKGFCFSVRTDEFCRSHIYNGYQLCLIEDVPELAAVTDVLRLDLQYYQPSKVAEITAIFAEALAAKRRDKAELADMKEQLAEVCGVKSNKFTKGHYYRGVE